MAKNEHFFGGKFKQWGSQLNLPVHPNTSDDHRGGYIGVFFPFSNA